MSSDPIQITASHPAEWIAALPVLVGYQLHDRATVTFTTSTGLMLCTAALPLDAPRQQVIDALTRQAPALRNAGARISWTAIHGLDPHDAHTHSRRLADALTLAGLPCPQPHTQYATQGDYAWLITPTGQPDPDAIWHLTDHRQVQDRLQLLLGTPADSRDDVGTDLVAAPGPLRDAIAAALPAAAAEPLADQDPARWRVTAAAETLARLTDPQPWTGPDAAAALLALSDHRVLTALLAHVRALPAQALLAPDSDQLAALVRSAPDTLVSGPATLLTACLTRRGMTSARAQTAASLALVDRPDNTAALALLAALTRGDNPLDTLAALTEHAPDLASPAGVLFAAGDGHWPDPLARPLTGPDQTTHPVPATPDGPTR